MNIRMIGTISVALVMMTALITFASDMQTAVRTIRIGRSVVRLPLEQTPYN